MERLPFPGVNFKKVAAVSLAAFAVFSPIAAILLAAVENPSWSGVGTVLASVAGGSLVIGFVPYFYELVSVALKRASRYGGAVEAAVNVRIRVTRATEYLRGLNTELPVQAIRDGGGTVHLVFPFGIQPGLEIGANIEVVTQTGGERLGIVELVEAKERFLFARPIDRTRPEFWEDLEDRMKGDFSPPADVVGRIFRFTGSVMSDVLGILEEESE